MSLKEMGSLAGSLPGSHFVTGASFNFFSSAVSSTKQEREENIDDKALLVG